MERFAMGAQRPAVERDRFTHESVGRLTVFGCARRLMDRSLGLLKNAQGQKSITMGYVPMRLSTGTSSYEGHMNSNDFIDVITHDALPYAMECTRYQVRSRIVFLEGFVNVVEKHINDEQIQALGRTMRWRLYDSDGLFIDKTYIDILLCLLLAIQNGQEGVKIANDVFEQHIVAFTATTQAMRQQLLLLQTDAAGVGGSINSVSPDVQTLFQAWTTHIQHLYDELSHIQEVLMPRIQAAVMQ
jgi:hypothetical protein